MGCYVCFNDFPLDICDMAILQLGCLWLLIVDLDVPDSGIDLSFELRQRFAALP